ncbi:hypothetical protein N8587_02425 [Akkermansiaceae bacterium]|nr:hypothetical protein [bacterium]MDA7670144.1 hypothetical protein [Akkermansiaceae bacterium]MDA7612217.1 hypothetical protein [bacterium]MDA7871525.1 hypothetical protein [Akkermansiaceae bacterium]MDA7873154.1 hypothetical protein [Akkermansiaceae bacterium]
MLPKPVIVHGFWATVMVAAFFVGTAWQKSATADSRTSKTHDQATRGQSTSPAPSETGISRTTLTRSNSVENDPISKLLETTSFLELGFESLAAMALKDPNQLKRRLAFSHLLSGMTSENAVQIREELIAAGVNDLDSEWRDFNYAWGTIAGEAAFSTSLTAEKIDLYSVISGWASTDPTGAIALLDQLPQDLAHGPDNTLRTQRLHLEKGVVAGLADRNRDEATNYVSKLLAEGRSDAPRLMETVANEVIRQDGSIAASDWVTTLKDGPLKGSAMGEVAESYARTNPASAAGWIQEFAAEEYATRAVAEVGKKWAEREPLAAVSWLEKLPEGQGQKAGLNSAFGDWEDRDPIAAGNYLLSMPNSPKRDSAIRGFAEGYAWQDPKTAIAWAQDIQDPTIRNESLKKVGFAYYRRKPEEARTWLTESGLSSETKAEILSSQRGR